MRQNSEWVKFIKEQYPPGTRIRLTEMRDPYAPVPPGTEGTVDFVDDACGIHMQWDNGRTLALIPGEDRFSVIPQPLQTLKLYMPLTVRSYERNEYGDMDDDPIELDGRTALSYEDHILAALLKERRPEETERGLMKYYGADDSVNRKVRSYVFTIERVQGQLMGVAECHVQGDLMAEELDRLKETIIGQAADGFGEGFEQRPIKTGDGEIYVSLWSSDKSWSIMTRDELEQGQQMGGMTLE
ncbi:MULTISPECIES: DUF4314 domain-containing protein [Eubacteriales]|jgi:hypothetical protein|uniref:DUF4314 domain-containing protein n=1 Tax=Caproicibacter fermentans TaxID=2576756 RepID=A0A7G8T8B5_9FIRM|nr:DUF4314 domain-containing protein [Caproicibacter fermentans]QNK39856.1 DUF4314 domain-containing protein [Caproicibacter fermentans]